MIKGKKVLIVGSSGGLGQAIARSFDEAGARLMLHGHSNQLALDELKSTLDNVVGTCIADISVEDEVISLMQATSASLGGLDAMVIASGTNPSARSIVDTPLTEWRRILDVNLTGPFLCLKHGITFLKRTEFRRGGKVVIVSSIFAVQSPPNRAAYGASKHGLTGLVQSASKEFGGPDSDIHINAICPGPVWGPNVYNIFVKAAEEMGVTVEEYSKQRLRKIPAGRFLDPKELSSLVIFLCSGASDYVNGQIINITGGAIE
jgi:NAD(P)-dependent dehydrogenase (short-subunit alcohol dehydrogenase family)